MEGFILTNKSSIALKYLTKLLLMQEADVQSYLMTKLLDYGYQPVLSTSEGNARYIYAVGKQPFLMVAHTDTVLATPTKLIISTNYVEESTELDPSSLALSGNTSLGADDRSGIAAILYYLDLGLRPYLLFPSGEESGGLGTNEFIKTDLSIFTGQVNFMIQFDRQGTNDAVQYSDSNDTLMKVFESTGFFKKAEGSFTDISLLMPVLGVSGLNLSIGYSGQHTANEKIDVNSFDSSIQEAYKILTTMDLNVKHQYLKRVLAPLEPYKGSSNTSLYYGEYDYKSSWGTGYTYNTKKKSTYKSTCNYCMGDFDECYQLSDGMDVCKECFNEPSNNLKQNCYGFCSGCETHAILNPTSLFENLHFVLSFNTGTLELGCPECLEPLEDVNLDVMVDNKTSLRDFIAAKMKGF